MEHFCENTTAKSCKIYFRKRFIVDVWYGSKYTLEVVEDSKINLKLMSAKTLEKTVHLLNIDLAGDTLRRDIRRYQKQQFVHVLLNSRSYKLRKIQSNGPAPESFFNLQPATLKEHSAYIFFREFCEIFKEQLCYGKTPANWFWKENFMKNGEPTFLL